MTTRVSNAERVSRHRAGLRAAGLRPVQIWVPDPRHPGFAEECRRQSRLTAVADQSDPTLAQEMDRLLADMED